MNQSIFVTDFREYIYTILYSVVSPDPIDILSGQLTDPAPHYTADFPPPPLNQACLT